MDRRSSAPPLAGSRDAVSTKRRKGHSVTTTNDSLHWIKSSYSNNGGACVEWAPEHTIRTGIVPVRDSKRPDGPVLMLSPSAFTGLVTLARFQEI
jgi:hypothetical protein